MGSGLGGRCHHWGVLSVGHVRPYPGSASGIPHSRFRGRRPSPLKLSPLAFLQPGFLMIAGPGCTVGGEHHIKEPARQSECLVFPTLGQLMKHC